MAEMKTTKLEIKSQTIAESNRRRQMSAEEPTLKQWTARIYRVTERTIRESEDMEVTVTAEGLALGWTPERLEQAIANGELDYQDFEEGESVIDDDGNEIATCESFGMDDDEEGVEDYYVLYRYEV